MPESGLKKETPLPPISNHDLRPTGLIPGLIEELQPNDPKVEINKTKILE